MIVLSSSLSHGALWKCAAHQTAMEVIDLALQVQDQRERCSYNRIRGQKAYK